MRLSLAICQTCGHLSRDHIGGRSRCQHDPRCHMECVRYVAAKRGNKYGAQRQIGGVDSKLEGSRFAELRLLEQAGAIRRLQIHPRLVVSPDGCRTIHYKPDSLYEEQQKDGRWLLVVEDCKAIGQTDGGRWPVVWALTRWRYPHAILRIVERDRRRRGFVIHDDPPRAIEAA